MSLSLQTQSQKALIINLFVRSNHEIMIRTRFKCRKKSLAIFANQLAGGVSLKILKYFEKMLILFKFSHLDNLPTTFRRCDLTLSFCPIIILQWNTAWKSVQIRCFFWSKYRKIRTRKSSVFGRFSPSEKWL